MGIDQMAAAVASFTAAAQRTADAGESVRRFGEQMASTMQSMARQAQPVQKFLDDQAAMYRQMAAAHRRMAALDRRRNTTASRAAAKRHLAEAHRLERRARRCRCVIRSTQLRITWLAPSPGAIEVSRRVTCLRAPRPGRTVLFRPEVRTA